MKILERLRNNSSRTAQRDAGPAEASSANDAQLPIAGYDHLDAKRVVAQLSPLTQEELAEVEAYERSHEERPVVLNRLRWLRVGEPVPGYDALDAQAIARELSGADAGTLKAVRAYERHHRGRQEVLREVARLLPESPVSAEEERASEEKAARVSAGIRSRD